MKEVFQENNRKRIVRLFKGEQLKKVGIISGILILLILTIIVVIKLGFFDISKVSIKNDKSVDTIYVSSSVINDVRNKYKGMFFFSASEESIKGIVKKDSFIKSYWVQKDLPNRITVFFLERKPIYEVDSQDGKCAILDDSAFTLLLANSAHECGELNSKYHLIKLTTTPFPSFVINNQSSYYYVFNINDIKKVFEEYGIDIQKVTIKDGVSTLTVGEKKNIVFSFNQPIEVQLARFVVVIEEIKAKNIKYSLLDLRYKRPVIRAQ